MGSEADVTQLLRQWRDGDADAVDALIPQLHAELQQISHRLMRRERPDHTLQPTALVNEAFERLIDIEVDWKDRTHFFALAARLMRRILINHAEARRAAKRGGGAIMVTLDEGSAAGEDPGLALLDVNTALEALAIEDQRKASLVEMQYFGGLTVEQMAEVTGTSVSTVTRELRFARAWLKDRLSDA